MRSKFKSLAFIGLAVLIALSSGAFVSTALADWVYGNPKASMDLAQEEDFVRLDLHFNESGDYLDSDTSRYDVYFFAQNGIVVSDLSEGVSADNCYYYRKASNDPASGNGVAYDCYDASYKDGTRITAADPVYGIFPDGSYYKSFTQATSIKDYQVPEDPFTLCSDRGDMAKYTEEDIKPLTDLGLSPLFDPIGLDCGWPLYFIGWSLVSYDGIYYNDPNHSNNPYRVNGSFPTQSHQMVLVTFNTLLSTYDQYKTQIGGRDALCFFPIYSPGKSYQISGNLGPGSTYTVDGTEYSYVETQVDEIKIKDMAKLDDGSYSTTATSERWFSYEPDLTEDIRQKVSSLYSSQYSVFTMPSLTIDPNTLDDSRCIIETDTAPWSGSNKPTLTQNNEVFDLKAALGGGSVNLYLLVRNYISEVENISHSDMSNMYKVLADNSIFAAGKHDLDTIRGNSSWGTSYNCRDYVIFVEYDLDPKLLGGSTETFDMSSSHDSAVFTRVNGTTSFPWAFEYRNVDIVKDYDQTMPYSFTYKGQEGQIYLPGNFVSVGMDVYGRTKAVPKLANLDTWKNLTDPNYTMDDVPSIKYIINGKTTVEYYHSAYSTGNDDEGLYQLGKWLGDSEFVSNVKITLNGTTMALSTALSNNADLSDFLESLPVYGVIDEGSYNFAMRMNFITDSENITTSVKDMFLFVHRSNVYRFVDIFSSVDDITVDPDSGYYEHDNYAYTSASYYVSGTDIALNDTYVDPVTQKTITLGELIDDIPSGYRLVDYLSGRILTRENLDPTSKGYRAFPVENNLVLYTEPMN